MYDFWELVYNGIIKNNKIPGFSLTLIIAPPKAGKTFLFRSRIAAIPGLGLLYFTYNNPMAYNVRKFIVPYNNTICYSGIRGAVHGLCVDLIYMDDIVKDTDEANSIVRMNEIKDCFDGSLCRLAPNGNIVFICTRFGSNDMIRHILDVSRKYWFNLKIIHIPFEARRNDFIGRKPGQYLFDCGEGWLLNQKKRMDTKSFEMLYNGRFV